MKISHEIHHILFSLTHTLECVLECLSHNSRIYTYTQQRHCGINTHSFIRSLSLSGGVVFFEKLCSEKSGDNVMKKYIFPPPHTAVAASFLWLKFMFACKVLRQFYLPHSCSLTHLCRKEKTSDATITLLKYSRKRRGFSHTTGFLSLSPTSHHNTAADGVTQLP